MKARKIIASMLVFVIAVALFPWIPTEKMFALEVIASGSCGPELTYSLDSEGVLVISGTGEMEDWRTMDRRPWNPYEDDVKKVILSEGVTSVSRKAFMSFENMTEAVIPSTMRSIDGFTKCSALETILLPEGLLEIGVQAFALCNRLKTVTIPSTVEKIGVGAFADCEMLTEIKVAPGNDSFTDADGVLFTKDMSKLIQYPGAKQQTSYVVPSTVTTIGEDAFGYAEQLEEIILPTNLTTLEDSSFSGSGIQSMTIPSGVTVIPFSAFNSCKKLKSIVMPENVKELGQFAFRNCQGLEKIVIENQECVFYDSAETISSDLSANASKYKGKIYGYANSTAQAYAEKYDLSFVPLDGIQKGDVDRNGEITLKDAYETLMYCSNHAIGNQAYTFTDGSDATLEAAVFTAADVDESSEITLQDAYNILMYSSYQSVGQPKTWEELLSK